MSIASLISQKWLVWDWVFPQRPSVKQGDTGVFQVNLFLSSCSHPQNYSAHLLAPTASDLVKYGQKDIILAGFHSDLNFLTIHGRSRYPGLHVWARNTGKRIPVRIPPGNNLLVQAGKQLEHLTGGLIKAGYHEVVVNEDTVAVSTIPRVEFFCSD